LKIAPNAFLEAFFVIVLGSSWGTPQPALENCSECLLGSFFRDYFKMFLGIILSSSWGPPSQPSNMVQNGSLGTFFVIALGSALDLAAAIAVAVAVLGACYST